MLVSVSGYSIKTKPGLNLIDVVILYKRVLVTNVLWSLRLVGVKTG